MRIDVGEENGACNYLFATNNPLVYVDPTGLVDAKAGKTKFAENLRLEGGARTNRANGNIGSRTMGLTFVKGWIRVFGAKERKHLSLNYHNNWTLTRAQRTEIKDNLRRFVVTNGNGVSTWNPEIDDFKNLFAFRTTTTVRGKKTTRNGKQVWTYNQFDVNHEKKRADAHIQGAIASLTVVEDELAYETFPGDREAFLEHAVNVMSVGLSNYYRQVDALQHRITEETTGQMRMGDRTMNVLTEAQQAKIQRVHNGKVLVEKRRIHPQAAAYDLIINATIPEVDNPGDPYWDANKNLMER
jgi:hypothetical protein